MPSLPSFRPVPTTLHSIATGVPDIELRVSELFDFELSEWQFDLLDTLFPAESATAIANLPPLTLSRDDEWVWAPDPHGVFSVASAYSLTKPWSIILITPSRVRLGANFGVFGFKIALNYFYGNVYKLPFLLGVFWFGS